MEKYRKRLVKQLKNLKEGTKDLVKYETVALSTFKDKSGLNEFFKWKDKNNSIIEKEFEKLCNEHNCIYQKCYVGPYQGNFWISKRYNY